MGRRLQLLFFSSWALVSACVFAQAPPVNPCAESHKGVYYANDFSYLLDPDYDGSCLGDALKLMPVAEGDWGTLDIGGQMRYRYHSEIGMGSGSTPRFQDTQFDFLLSRLRLYSNWKASDVFRIYVEGIYADTTDDGGAYTPRAIDQNFGDFLNAFVDVKLTDTCTARVGRQELLYGNQRLISPLDWANTRRTFDGARLLYKEGDWGVDSFYTFFVPVRPNELDEADYHQRFYGIYGNYAGFENFTVEPYYIGYDNLNPGAITADFSIHTVGMRLNGGMGDWLWEFEGGPQFGRQSGLGLDQQAQFATIGLGRKLVKHPGGPVIWFYYDYASGPTGGDSYNGFNQLFPLAHKYFGFIDAVQRSNIESPNILFTMKPGPKWNLLMWYWHFMSNTTAPVPSIGNTPPQNASKDFGDELDVLVRYTIGPRSSVWFGWSHLWRGSKIIGDSDADFIYSYWETDF
jgi:hypothetical protein